MEEVLKDINKFVSLNREDVKESNEKLVTVLEEYLIPEMKENPLFKKLYTGIDFGGSFYDDLKVGKSNEFDLDFKLSLKKICQIHNKKKCSCINIDEVFDKCGYLNVRINNDDFSDDKDFKNWLDDDGYVRNDKVLDSWFMSIVTIALNKANKAKGKIADLNIDLHFKRKSGPAVTLTINKDQEDPIDIDVVPAFTFDESYWPEDFRKFSNLGNFLLVPKSEREDENRRYWRASFQSQEKILIKDKGKLKPSLRLLKKMRSSLGQENKIASYYLKTLVLWDVEKSLFDWSSNLTLSEGFMHLVERYLESLDLKEIPYYWKESSNLLRKLYPDTLVNYYGHVNGLYDKVKKDPSNREAIAKLILKENSDEYKKFINRIADAQQQKELNNLNAITNISLNKEPTENTKNIIVGKEYQTNTTFDSVQHVFNDKYLPCSYLSNEHNMPHYSSVSRLLAENAEPRKSRKKSSDENEGNGLLIAGGVIVGAAALIGLGMWAFSSDTDHENEKRKDKLKLQVTEQCKRNATEINRRPSSSKIITYNHAGNVFTPSSVNIGANNSLLVRRSSYGNYQKTISNFQQPNTVHKIPDNFLKKWLIVGVFTFAILSGVMVICYNM